MLRVFFPPGGEGGGDIRVTSDFLAALAIHRARRTLAEHHGGGGTDGVMAPKTFRPKVACLRPGCDGTCPLHVVLRSNKPDGVPAKCFKCDQTFKKPVGVSVEGQPNKKKEGGGGDDAKDRELRQLRGEIQALKAKQAGAAPEQPAKASDPQDEELKKELERLVADEATLKGMAGAEELLRAKQTRIAALRAQRLAGKPHHQQLREIDEKLEKAKRRVAVARDDTIPDLQRKLQEARNAEAEASAEVARLQALRVSACSAAEAAAIETRTTEQCAAVAKDLLGRLRGLFSGPAGEPFIQHLTAIEAEVINYAAAEQAAGAAAGVQAPAPTAVAAAALEAAPAAAPAATPGGGATTAAATGVPAGSAAVAAAAPNTGAGWPRGEAPPAPGTQLDETLWQAVEQAADEDMEELDELFTPPPDGADAPADHRAKRLKVLSVCKRMVTKQQNRMPRLK